MCKPIKSLFNLRRICNLNKMPLTTALLYTIFSWSCRSRSSISVNIFLSVFHAKLVAAKSQKHLPSSLPWGLSASHRKPDFDFLIVGCRATYKYRCEAMPANTDLSQSITQYPPEKHLLNKRIPTNPGKPLHSWSWLTSELAQAQLLFLLPILLHMKQPQLATLPSYWASQFRN